MKRGGLRIPIGVKRPNYSVQSIGRKAVRAADVGWRKTTNTLQDAIPVAMLAGADGLGPTPAYAASLGAAATGVTRKFVTQPLRRALGD